MKDYKEKIIITMTSWSKRLTNIPCVLDTIFNQTIKPDNIVINLSSEEFPNKENDIPNNVLEYIKNHNNIIINWVGKNIKSWKKTIPTFNLFPNDVIITIDDDKLYPSNFIEFLWNKHLEYPNNPITIDAWKWPNGFWQHCGQASLEKKDFYDNDIDKWLLTEITNFADEDSFMTFMAVKHGNPFISAGKIQLIDYNNDDGINGKDGGKAYFWISNKLNDKFENYLYNNLENLIFKNIKNIKIQGNLGNLLFQFAYVYSIIVNSKDKCYNINQLPIDINNLEYKPIQLGIDNGIFYGWKESEQFFDQNLIRKIYSPSENIKIQNKNKFGNFENSLFISVRRGDFLKISYFICLNAKFYNDAYNKLNKKYDKIFLSTDDYKWCKENIHIPDIIFLENETPINTIYIASMCKDFIISNSTFSWWCAWLGEINNGTIICPDKHFYDIDYHKNENKIYFPDRWEKIPVIELGYDEKH